MLFLRGAKILRAKECDDESKRQHIADTHLSKCLVKVVLDIRLDGTPPVELLDHCCGFGLLAGQSARLSTHRSTERTRTVLCNKHLGAALWDLHGVKPGGPSHVIQLLSSRKVNKKTVPESEFVEVSISGTGAVQMGSAGLRRAGAAALAGLLLCVAVICCLDGEKGDARFSVLGEQRLMVDAAITRAMDGAAVHAMRNEVAAMPRPCFQLLENLRSHLLYRYQAKVSLGLSARARPAEMGRPGREETQRLKTRLRVLGTGRARG